MHTFRKGGFQVHGHVPEFSPTSRAYFIGTDVQANESGMVGVLQGWTVRQGNIQELSPDNDIYKQVVLDWLASEGISTPDLGTLHIFRADLEVDGVDEILITATYIDGYPYRANAGDFSIVLLRKVVGNGTVTVPLVTDVYRAQQEVIYPATYSVGNFIDLNRDGVLEVIVEIQGWEQFGAQVYEINGQTATQVLK